jgi:hypothetical protein
MTIAKRLKKNTQIRNALSSNGTGHKTEPMFMFTKKNKTTETEGVFESLR